MASHSTLLREGKRLNVLLAVHTGQGDFVALAMYNDLPGSHVPGHDGVSVGRRHSAPRRWYTFADQRADVHWAFFELRRAKHRPDYPLHDLDRRHHHHPAH